ncbi:helix-turn-helix transcriptional regulator [Shewanella khirikhana]|uniref:helix-turn-helix domain-containing protein n=1 Tax=Shewanella khirikhana TaxID=1965282 RepID=UPI0030D0EB0E
MSLGLKIKDFRQTAGMSQPQLAEAIGIEQSYLSKLENDKSLPSADVLSRLLSAMGIDLETLLSDPLLGTDKQRLAQLPEVADNLKQQRGRRLNERKGILLASSLLVAISSALFYAGESKLLFSEDMHIYSSRGIELAGEPNGIFDEDVFLAMVRATDAKDYRKEMDVTRAQMMSRESLETRMLATFQGKRFTEAVEGGKRTFGFDGIKKISRPVNAWLRIVGVFGFCLGLLGFFIEWRLGRMAKG